MGGPRYKKETAVKMELRWTRLPQGIIESPNLFGQAVEGLLEQFIPKEDVQILQYVDGVRKRERPSQNN